MSLLFDNKVALITGAAGGIGRASAIAFSKQGAKVVAVDIDSRRGEETVRLIKNAGREAVFMQVNVVKASEVERLIAEIQKLYGRLDYAHNNAGVEGRKAALNEQTEEDWDHTINVNLKSVWLCMKYEIQAMRAAGAGAIVNTGSVASQVGLRNYAPYAASKHGVIGLTKTAAIENVKHNIRVNAVCPGLIDTEMIVRSITGDPDKSGFLTKLKVRVGQSILASKQPSGRMGLAVEVAEAVIWLCSEQASYVNGHALAVDGGFLAK